MPIHWVQVELTDTPVYPLIDMVSLPTYRMEDLTTFEIESALEAGFDTVLFAVGSVEQHGPHLPIKMDTLAGDVITERLANRLGDALAAPTLRPGCSGHHMDFPGTITIPPETLMELISGYCRSLDAHGFEYIVPIATHGGNFAPLQSIAPELARELDATIVPFADLGEYMRLMNEAMRDVIDLEEPVIHAGAAETAIFLAEADELVRTDALTGGYTGSVSTSKLFSEGFRAITENGVLGDPTAATPEAGEAILESIVDSYAAQIEKERAS